MPVKAKSEPAPRSHDGDFHAWTLAQADALRARRLEDLDFANLAEEIEGLGRSEKREIRSRLLVLLLHLLKWRHQPEQRSNSWRASIVGSRKELARELIENPSLHAYPAEVLKDQYEVARLQAAAETGLPETTFPRNCPFGVQEILNAHFWPEPSKK